MIFNKKSEQTVKNIALYTGITDVKVKEVFRLLLNEILCNYDDKSTEVTTIPLLGTLGLEYHGDEIVKGEDGRHYKQAEVSVVFSPDDHLKRVLGQLKDGDTTDIESFMQRKISQSLHAEYTEE